FYTPTATTEISTLSLHDALPISRLQAFRLRNIEPRGVRAGGDDERLGTNLFAGDVDGLFAHESCAAANQLDPRFSEPLLGLGGQDRKSTRLNSSHVAISYAVFRL